MKRREFIMLLGGGAAVPVFSPIRVSAQQTDQPRRVGVLISFAETDPESKERIAAFRHGLEKRGWSEGGNIHVDYRFASGEPERFSTSAKELIASRAEVIVAHTPPSVNALLRESRTVPIVFVNVSDPIGAGFIASLARPGGNLTGVIHLEVSIVGKWLALLKEIAPQITRAVLLSNRATNFDYFLGFAQTAASSLSLQLTPSPVESSDDIKRSIETAAATASSGLILPPDFTTLSNRDLIIELAARHRLPAVYALRTFVAAGGLISYGTDQNEMFRLAASYVDRILRGDKPSDLPVQAPTKFQTVLNLTTAKRLGLTVPPGLLLVADELIE